MGAESGRCRACQQGSQRAGSLGVEGQEGHPPWPIVGGPALGLGGAACPRGFSEPSALSPKVVGQGGTGVWKLQASAPPGGPASSARARPQWAPQAPGGTYRTGAKAQTERRGQLGREGRHESRGAHGPSGETDTQTQVMQRP